MADDPNQVHKVLSSLDIPLYLTTNCDSFMVEALTVQGKKPKREVCQWHAGLAGLDSQFDDPDYEPAVKAPLVYHLFGSDEQASEGEEDTTILVDQNTFSERPFTA